MIPPDPADDYSRGVFHALQAIERYLAIPDDRKAIAAIRAEWRTDVANAIIEVLYRQ